MKSKGWQIVLHIVAWSVFLLLPLVFFPKPRILLGDEFGGRFFISFFISGLLLIGFFYFTLYFAIPRFFLTRKYVVFTLLCLLALALVFFAVWLTDIAQAPPPKGPGGPPDFPGGGPLPALGSVLIRFLVVLFFAFGMSIYNRWKQAEREKMNAELSFLKAQINPHFLFNTLNSIYSLAIRKSDTTADAVIKLSSIMRYVITDAHQDKSSLEKELKYVADYVELQKLRLPPTASVKFSVSGPVAGLVITPLLFVPFIENAFKHGISTEEESPVVIDISVIGHSLHLWVNNRKMKSKTAKIESSGIGVENTRQRLQLLYRENHILSITDTETEFSVKLVIKLK